MAAHDKAEGFIIDPLVPSLDFDSLHIPVLKDKVVSLLVTNPSGVYVDCTVDGGGHAQAILESLSPSGRLIGLDVDQIAVEIASRRLASFGDRVRLFQANFTELEGRLDDEGIDRADGILFDLGISSIQVDTPERGFSYLHDGPLDMRMDSSSKKSAWEVVNLFTEEELTRTFRGYGEERLSPVISRTIVKARRSRSIDTTKQLVEIIEGVIPKRNSQKALARIFQAIRIEVNDELANLRIGLQRAIGLLKSEGRVGAISYHSLEDRIVKAIFSQKAKGCICPADFPRCVCGQQKELKLMTRGVVRPSPEEIASNRRARGAKLRVAERI